MFVEHPRASADRRGLHDLVGGAGDRRAAAEWRRHGAAARPPRHARRAQRVLHLQQRRTGRQICCGQTGA
jgi:hypothetical protein